MFQLCPEGKNMEGSNRSNVQAEELEEGNVIFHCKI